MNRKSKSLFVIILLIGLVYVHCAQAATGNRSTIDTTKEASASKMEDVTVLKAQLSLMREFNQNILSTVYWSLGTIVLIVILLVSFSWFTNYRMYERELAALRQELIGLLDKQMAAFSSEFNQKSIDKFTDISERSIEAVHSVTKQIVTPLQGKIAQCTQDISQLQYNALNVEARYWEFKGVKGNQASQYIRMLRAAIEMKNEFNIAECMGTLLKLIEDGAPVFENEITAIVGLLNTLEPKYSTHAEALRNALKNAKKSSI
jgi:hypothetical protein